MKRNLPYVALVLAIVAGHATAQPFEIEVPLSIEPAQSVLTRAEVIADFHVWRLAGLQDLTRGEQSVDPNSYQYRKAFAVYLALRNSPQFAALVKEIQRNPQVQVAAVRQARRVGEVTR